MTSTDDSIIISHGITPGGLGLVSQGSIPGGPEATVEVKWKTRGEAAVNLLRAQRDNDLRLRVLLAEAEPRSHWATAKRIRIGSKILSVGATRNHYDNWLIRIGLIELSPEGISRAKGSRILGVGTRRRAFFLSFGEGKPEPLTDTRESLYEAPRALSSHPLPEPPLAEADALTESAEDSASSSWVAKTVLTRISLEGLNFAPVLENPLLIGDSLEIPAGTETWDFEGESTTANRLRRVKVTGISRGHYAVREATEDERAQGYLGAVIIVPSRVYWGNGKQHVELTEGILRENQLPVIWNSQGHEPLAVAMEWGHYDISGVILDSETANAEAVEAAGAEETVEG